MFVAYHKRGQNGRFGCRDKVVKKSVPLVACSLRITCPYTLIEQGRRG